MEKHLTIFTCKNCGCGYIEMPGEDMEEVLWGHLQCYHNDLFEELQDFETPDMISSAYTREVYEHVLTIN